MTERFATNLCSAILITCSNLLLAEEVTREWKVASETRQALIFLPSDARDRACPVIFAFHGHGGTMQHASRSFQHHQHWPEAIVVYPQGLNTPGKLTDPEGKKTGWQAGPGAQSDRDLKFFDVMLSTLKSDYRIDEKRIYATGHSSGGSFTYLLWNQRGDVFAALGPSAAAALVARRANLEGFMPKPIIHIAGTNDLLVKFAWQEATLKKVKEINRCEDTGKDYLSNVELAGTVYESTINTPVVTLLHQGGHKYLTEAWPIIMKFFQQHTKP